MGTAAKFQGPEPASALIPTWLDEPSEEVPHEEPSQTEPAPPDQDIAQEATADPHPTPRQPLPPTGEANRFTSARRSFNSSAQTQDRGSLGRAVSSYVRNASGGSRAATRKMGGARRATGRVVSFLGDVTRTGVATALRNLGFGHLVGQPADVALAALTDAFCPAGGPIDQAIARDAWDEAVLTLAEEGIADVSDVTPDQWQALLVDFMTNAIQARVFNEIGSQGISLPADIAGINRLQEDLHDIIRGAVVDAVGDRFDAGRTVPQSEIEAVVDAIYQHAFAYLEALEE